MSGPDWVDMLRNDEKSNARTGTGRRFWIVGLAVGVACGALLAVQLAQVL